MGNAHTVEEKTSNGKTRKNSRVRDKVFGRLGYKKCRDITSLSTGSTQVDAKSSTNFTCHQDISTQSLPANLYKQKETKNVEEKLESEESTAYSLSSRSNKTFFTAPGNSNSEHSLNEKYLEEKQHKIETDVSLTFKNTTPIQTKKLCITESKNFGKGQQQLSSSDDYRTRSEFTCLPFEVTKQPQPMQCSLQAMKITDDIVIGNSSTLEHAKLTKQVSLPLLDKINNSINTVINNKKSKLVLNFNDLETEKVIDKSKSNLISDKVISIQTDSWRTAKVLSNLACGTPTTGNVRRKGYDVIVLHEQTSSSSDSTFADPLTPPGEDTIPANQCSTLEENDFDTKSHSIDFYKGIKTSVLPITKEENKKIKKLEGLGLSEVYSFSLGESTKDNNKETEMANNVWSKITSVGGGEDKSNNENGVFCIAKAKKVELQNLSSKLTDNSSVSDSKNSPSRITQENNASFSTLNQTKTLETNENLSSQYLLTPTLPVCTKDGNVLMKVASFTVEKSYSDNATKRSTQVPEKLNFTACEKFEGQMLIKWLASSIQMPENSIAEQELLIIVQQFCLNLVRAGVIKQISDKDDKNFDSFNPFCMYQWSYKKLPQLALVQTPKKLDKNELQWCHMKSSTPIQNFNKLNSPLTSGERVSSSNIEMDLNDKLLEIKKKLIECNNINEILEIISKLSQYSKNEIKCSPLDDVLNESELTIYERTKKETRSIGCLAAINNEKYKNHIHRSLQTDLEILYKKNDSSTQTEVTKEEYFSSTRISEVSPDCPKLPESLKSPETTKSFPIPPPPPPPPPPPLPSLLLTQSADCPVVVPKRRPETVPPPIPPPLPGKPATDGNTITNNKGVVSTISATDFQSPKLIPSAPMLMPPVPGAWLQKNILRKNAINPPKPMKPLYWTRIVAPKQSSDIIANDKIDKTKKKELWEEIDETNLDNIDEFTELFCRQAIIPKAKQEIPKPNREKTAKVLDSKRSQNVGIFSQSLHVDFSEIEHAIYHCDTSVVSLETLQHIMSIKATPEEIALIKDAVESKMKLDRPEDFLYKVASISLSSERISCIVFISEFEEGCLQVGRKLDTIKQLCIFINESEDLKFLFSIILTLGNYMNGGNRTRGQADGFGLEILGKLKDVKSKDSKITLLHFIVKTYISRRRKDGIILPEITLPIPEPGDVDKAVSADFDEIQQQITDLGKKLRVCKNTTEKVIALSDSTNLEPFQSKMEEFNTIATQKNEKQLKKLDNCRTLFRKTIDFYHFIPKTGTRDQCTPGQFFEYWAPFTNDFKDIWKKEMVSLSNEILKKMKQSNTKETKANKVKPGSLKERLQRLSKK